MNKTLLYIFLLLGLIQCLSPPNNPTEISDEEIWRLESKKSQRFADSLNRYINYDSIISSAKGFVNDSIHPYINIFQGDTQAIFSTGGITPVSRIEYLHRTRNPRFGKNEFYGGIHYQGKIKYLSLIKREYVKEAGNLYFVRNIGDQLILNDSLIKGLTDSLIIKNTEDCLFDKTQIAGQTQIEGKLYYKLLLTGTCGKTGLKQYLIINEDLVVIENVHLRNAVNKKIREES